MSQRIIDLLAECNEFIKKNPSEYGLELPVADVKIIAEVLKKQVPKVLHVRFHADGSPENICSSCEGFVYEEAFYCHICGQRFEVEYDRPV